MPAQLHVDLERELDVIVDRLREQFDDVDLTTIDEIVHQHAARFAGAPVQNFAAILTERAAKQTLERTDS